MEDFVIKFTEETHIKKLVFQTSFAAGDGLFFGIEVKDPKGKPSAIQLVQGARIQKAGGHFLIAKSLQDVKDYILEKGFDM